MDYHKDNGGRNIYYWYYGTQVMHNQPGPDWDTWNRKIRRLLIDSQCKEDNCAVGSWDPVLPKKDEWADHAGRLYLTSLSALTLEVYYRYLPLYKLDRESEVGGGAPPTSTAAKPEAEKPAQKAIEKDAAEAATKAAPKPQGDYKQPVKKAAK
jgi:hypothetical protein